MITLNNKKISPTIFPDGTSQVWNVDIPQVQHRKTPVELVWWFEEEAEYAHVLQMIHLLEHYGVRYVLMIPYAPYARQDKAVGNTESFAGTVLMYNILSRQVSAFGSIRFLDLHSDQGYWFQNVQPTIPSGYDTYIFPDSGALERYEAQFELVEGKNIVVGKKVRNSRTGHISSFSLSGEVTGNTLVVDDICDGGATFKILAKSLNFKPDLYVTHGIFSKGINTLLESYETVYTTTSYAKNNWFALDKDVVPGTIQEELLMAKKAKRLLVFDALEWMRKYEEEN